MKAEEMFKELGYVRDDIIIDKKKKIIRYKDYICFTTICFYYTNVSVCINNISIRNYDEAIIKLNKAIQQQIKELGWE